MDLKIENGIHIILGSFVGILTVQGVIIGASVFGDTSFIINVALGGAVALALANCAGSYVTRSAKEYDKLSRLEKPLLRSLDNTKIKKLTEKKCTGLFPCNGWCKFYWFTDTHIAFYFA